MVVTLGRFAAPVAARRPTRASSDCAARSYPFAHGVLIPTLHPAAAPPRWGRSRSARCGRLRAGQGWRWPPPGRRDAITLRTTAVGDDEGGRGGAGRARPPRRPHPCSPGSWAPARPRSPRASRAGLGVPRHGHQPDVHPRPHATTGRLAHAPRRRLPPGAAWPRWPTWARRAARRRRRRRCWWSGATSCLQPGRAVTVRLEPPTDHLDDRVLTIAPPAPWASAGPRPVGHQRAWPPLTAGAIVLAACRTRPPTADLEPAVLILGIETATEQVSVRHRWPRGRDRRLRGQPAADGTPRSLTPGHRVRAASQADIALGELGAVAVDVGPRPVHRACASGIATAKAMAHALRVPMIGVASLDLLALPAAPRRPAHRRRHRRPPERGVLRLLPAGAGRRAAAWSRRPSAPLDDLVGRALGHRRGGPPGRRRCAPLPRQITARGLRGLEFAEQWLGPAQRPPLVQLAHARALREEWVQPVRTCSRSTCGGRTPRSTGHRGSRPGGRPREDPPGAAPSPIATTSSCASAACVAATCAAILTIEQQVYPRALVRCACSPARSTRSRAPAATSWRTSGDASSATAG